MKRKIAAVAVLVLGFTLAGAQAASADSSQNFTWSGNLVASGSFTSDGEIVTVRDRRADGYGVQLEISSGLSGLQTCVNTSGNGTTKTCNLDFPEGAKVVWRLRLVNNGSYVATAFSDPVVDYA